MTDTKPATLWAVVSLVCSVLGCLAFLALMALGERYTELANASAGLGGIWAVLHVTLAIALCLLGALLGVIALVRIRRGERGGRGMAWAGIILGCLPWVLSVVWNADFNPWR
jgi:hypothetical protein